MHQSHFVGRILGSAGVVPHHFVRIWWIHFVEGRGCASPFCRDCKNHFVEEELVTSETICIFARTPNKQILSREKVALNLAHYEDATLHTRSVRKMHAAI